MMTIDTAIEKYYNYVYDLLFGKTAKDKCYTEECCNYIFFLLSLRLDKLKDEMVYPWLLKTAKNKLKEYFRKRKKESYVIYLEDITYEPADTTELADRMIKDEDIEAAVQKLLSLLTKEERQMYEDYFVHKLTYVEIAEKFGIDRNTASKRLHKIRRKLEEEAYKIFSIAGTFTILRILTVLFDR